MLALCVKNVSCIDKKCLATRPKTTRTSEAVQHINFMVYQSDLNVALCGLSKTVVLMVYQTKHEMAM